MKNVLIIVADDYQDLEVWYPLLRFREAGWKVTSAGIENRREYKGKRGYPIRVDTVIEEIKADDYDVVVIPGGWAPDYIRQNETAVRLVHYMHSKGKVVAAICHGGWVLASAKILEGRKATSFSGIRDDMEHAGAEWTDAEVVIDKNLITSRTPDDLPAFCRAILELA